MLVLDGEHRGPAAKVEVLVDFYGESNGMVSLLFLALARRRLVGESFSFIA